MCEFLIFYKICAEYEDENKNVKLFEYELENTVQERFITLDSRDYYRESLCDYYDRLEEDKHYFIDRALESMPKQNIYKNNTWLCDVYKKQNFLSLLSKNKIYESSVRAVWKQADYCIM